MLPFQITFGALKHFLFTHCIIWVKLHGLILALEVGSGLVVITHRAQC